MKWKSLIICVGLAITFSNCSNNKDLELGITEITKGDGKNGVTLLKKVINESNNQGDIDRARKGLAGFFMKEKQYYKAMDQLKKISKPEGNVQDMIKSCSQEVYLTDAIKSAAVQYRQKFKKEKELNHKDIDYSQPVFSGNGDDLFKFAELVMPNIIDFSKIKIEVKLTEDPLEPTKINIVYADGSKRTIALNN